MISRRMTDLYTRRTAVYCLFATDGELLYVGASHDPENRIAAHKTKPWWPDVATTTVEWHPDRLTALGQEARTIADQVPVHNVRRPNPDHFHALKSVLDFALAKETSQGPRLTFEQAAEAVDVPVDWLWKGVATGTIPHSCDGPASNRVWFSANDIRDLHVIYDPLPVVLRSQRESQRAHMRRDLRLKRCTHA